jgi:hypothetical protein
MEAKKATRISPAVWSLSILIHTIRQQSTFVKRTISNSIGAGKRRMTHDELTSMGVKGIGVYASVYYLRLFATFERFLFGCFRLIR